MNISFPTETPVYRADDLTLSFAAIVDGKRLRCAISAEALEDHFGAASLADRDLIAAFNAHRGAIKQGARQILEEIGAKPVLLRSGYFRFYS